MEEPAACGALLVVPGRSGIGPDPVIVDVSAAATSCRGAGGAERGSVVVDPVTSSGSGGSATGAGSGVTFSAALSETWVMPWPAAVGAGAGVVLGSLVSLASLSVTDSTEATELVSSGATAVGWETPVFADWGAWLLEGPRLTLRVSGLWRLW